MKVYTKSIGSVNGACSADISHQINRYRLLYSTVMSKHTQKMQPYEIFKDIFNKWLSKTGTFVGHNVLDPKFKISPNTIFILITLIVYTWSCFYTIFAYELRIGLQCAGVTGLGLQVYTKKNIFLI